MRRMKQKSGSKPRAKGRSQAAQRRMRSRFTWRPTRRSLFGLSLALGALSLGWLWHDGWFERQVARGLAWAYQTTADAGFAVDDVLVEGRQRTEAGAILAALEVDRGSPIFALDPHLARERLEGLPWVRSASVERRLPELIYVRLVEREPLALWQLDGKISVIDNSGAVIAGAESWRFTSLPLVVGPDAPNHAAQLLDVLDSEPELKPLVIAAVRVGGRRWNLRLEGGIDVQLPEQETAQAWAQLARVERQHGLLSRDVATIDLRLPDRLIVHTTAKSETGENT